MNLVFGSFGEKRELIYDSHLVYPPAVLAGLERDAHSPHKGVVALSAGQNMEGGRTVQAEGDGWRHPQRLPQNLVPQRLDGVVVLVSGDKVLRLNNTKGQIEVHSFFEPYCKEKKNKIK